MISGELPAPRVYLFLHSHPSLFNKVLVERMRAAGAECHLINLSLGDRLFRHGTGAVNFRGRLRDWPRFLAAFIRDKRVTDIVYYADQRPYHRIARTVARDHGVRCFAYEFGYLRPDWITLEREGMGVLSHFPDDPDLVERLAAEVGDHQPPNHRYPFTFAAEAVNEVTYHLTPVFLPFLYPHYVRDRFYHPLVEYVSYLPKLFRRRRNHRRANAVIRQLVAAGTPYFVVVMQMQGDYQVRRSSPYRRLHDCIDQIIESFGRHAPAGSRLVFKMHPLENGIENWPAVIRARSVAGGCGDRVDVIDGGDLSALLHDCRGVVTLNSTAGLTALIEGVPVKTLGIAVYDMPRVTFQGPLDAFWHEARPPERRTVKALVELLAATIQVKGNFFTPAGRAAAAAEVTRRLTSADVHNFGAFVDPPPRLEKARRLGVPGADDALEIE